MQQDLVDVVGLGHTMVGFVGGCDAENGYDVNKVLALVHIFMRSRVSRAFITPCHTAG